MLQPTCYWLYNIYVLAVFIDRTQLLATHITKVASPMQICSKLWNMDTDYY